VAEVGSRKYGVCGDPG